jgi:protein-S-isoprenylcysteine O-methyltransferase Ste14
MSPTVAVQSSSSFAPRRWNELRRTIAAFVVRRRVRITVAVFVLLVLEDMLIGVRPHDILNLRDPETLIGLALIAFGVLVRSWAAGVLHKTWELTTTGPYAMIRNPLYVGSFLIMSGFATLIDDVENIFVILGPLTFVYYLQVLHEERALAQKYEARWAAYADRVPRFLPRGLPAFGSLFGTWNLRDWRGSREYRALASTALGVLALEIWRRWPSG